jgi:hypothetical protein
MWVKEVHCFTFCAVSVSTVDSDDEESVQSEVRKGEEGRGKCVAA